WRSGPPPGKIAKRTAPRDAESLRLISVTLFATCRPAEAVRNRSLTMQKLVAIAFVLTVIVLAAPAATFAYTDEERQACQDDAFRLCGQFVPDEQRVKACLIQNMSRLSPACRRLFQRGR